MGDPHAPGSGLPRCHARCHRCHSVAGTPNFIVQVQDDDFGFPADRIQMYEFHVDWTNTAASTLVQTTTLTPNDFTAKIDPHAGAGATGGLPQPGAGAATLDSAGGTMMYRMTYRNFGGHEAIAFNYTIAAPDDPGPSGNNIHSAIRWYELRRPGAGAWSIFQQGTHSPDASNRWFGSIAMDGNEDIALGYVVGSSTVFPSIRYAGRLANDPLGTLPEVERSLAEGQGSLFPPASGGYADYSEMSVDPLDDCMFWLTNTYVPANSNTSRRSGRSVSLDRALPSPYTRMGDREPLARRKRFWQIASDHTGDRQHLTPRRTGSFAGGCCTSPRVSALFTAGMESASTRASELGAASER